MVERDPVGPDKGDVGADPTEAVTVATPTAAWVLRRTRPGNKCNSILESSATVRQSGLRG